MDMLNAELYFEKANDTIRVTKGDVFKLELLDEYNTSFEKQWQFFKRNGRVSADMLYEYVKGSHDRAREFKRRGIRFRRVHVVSLPLSVYLRFEMESYKIFEKMGESVYLIERKKFAKIAKPSGMRPMDLLATDECVFLVKYANVRNNIGGELVGSFLIDEPEKVKKYKGYVERILKKAVPLNKFLRAIKS